MIRTQNVLQLLHEAKSFKNHVRKKDREKIDHLINSAIALDSRTYTSQGQKYSEILGKAKIYDTNSLVEHIESIFRRRKFNYHILSQYVKWVVETVARGEEPDIIALVAQTESLAHALLKFDKLKRLEQFDDETPDDIEEFSWLGGFVLMMNSHENPVDEKELYRQREAKLLHEDSNFKLVDIKSHRAAKFFGRGARSRSCPWCIVEETPAHYDRYEKDGFEWIFLLVKKSTEKYAIDKIRGTVWGEQNENIWFSDLERLFPIISKYVKNTMQDLIDDIRNTLGQRMYEYFHDMEIDFSADYDLMVEIFEIEAYEEGPDLKYFVRLWTNILIDEGNVPEDSFTSKNVEKWFDEVDRTLGIQLEKFEYPRGPSQLQPTYDATFLYKVR